jgi:hypothetical protein
MTPVQGEAVNPTKAPRTSEQPKRRRWLASLTGSGTRRGCGVDANGDRDPFSEESLAQRPTWQLVPVRGANAVVIIVPLNCSRALKWVLRTS